MNDLHEVAAVEVLHDDERTSALFHQIVDAHDVRVVQAGGDARLVAHHPQEVVVADESGQHTFDDNRLAAALAARQINLRHPAFAELAVDDVAVDVFERRGHGCAAFVRAGPQRNRCKYRYLMFRPRAVPGRIVQPLYNSFKPGTFTRAMPKEIDDFDTIERPGPGGVESTGLCLIVNAEGLTRTHPLPERGDVTIGRGSANVIRIDHPSVSRFHAVLRM